MGVCGRSLLDSSYDHAGGVPPCGHGENPHPFLIRVLADRRQLGHRQDGQRQQDNQVYPTQRYAPRAESLTVGGVVKPLSVWSALRRAATCRRKVQEYVDNGVTTPVINFMALGADAQARAEQSVAMLRALAPQ